MALKCIKRKYCWFERADNAQRTYLSSYSAETIYMKLDVYSFENSVDPDHLASEENS